ncbi:hypothetical protein IFM89_034886 [Coptis chinensis]|uniref:GTP cyclohydrolase 1 n=1 Tax=Coptis chinensis TaxID=261450 RepID=A0A835I828_9MAGN|nr:hypothetical protein IFM89_034886 [Coptis chinensis]
MAAARFLPKLISHPSISTAPNYQTHFKLHHIITDKEYYLQIFYRGILRVEVGELSRCLELLKGLKCRVPVEEKILEKGYFRAGFEVKRRVNCLCRHGMILRETFKIVQREPRVILYDLEDIEKKIEFLKHKMRFGENLPQRVLEYLGVNFDKQIVLRHNVLEYLRSKGGLGSEVGLRGYRQKVRYIVQGALFLDAGLDGDSGCAGGAGGLVVVRDLNLFSYYEVCSSLYNGMGPAGVGVVLQCWHIEFPQLDCTCHDQINHPTIMDMQGRLKKFRGVKLDKLCNGSSSTQRWCPSRSLDLLAINGHRNTWNPLSYKTSIISEPAPASMITAVATILHSLGEKPSRKELVGTPRRFVQWLMNFNSSNLGMNLNGFGAEGMCEIKCRKQTNKDGVRLRPDRVVFRSKLNLPFWSQCEHHLLLFHGVVHIGYFRTEGIEPIGRAILQSIVHFHGWKLQVQERLTKQIAETVSSVMEGNFVVLL